MGSILDFCKGDSGECIYCGRKAFHVNTMGLPYLLRFHSMIKAKRNQDHRVCKRCRKLEIEEMLKKLERNATDVEALEVLLQQVKACVSEAAYKGSNGAKDDEPTDDEIEELESILLDNS